MAGTIWSATAAPNGTGYATTRPPGISAPWRRVTKRLIYHSGKDKAAVGIARIARAAQADGDDGRWVSVRVEPVRPLARPVTLAAMKAEPALADMAMLRQSRLSVSPVTDAAWQVLMRMAG